jgi:hypothetical protein
MKLNRLAWVSAILGAVFTFSPNAHANTYLYTFTNAVTNFSFQLDSQPTVPADGFSNLGFQVPITTTLAASDILFAQFFSAPLNLGGIGFANDLTYSVDSAGTTLVYDGLQLYSGDEAVPTLLLGSYLLTNTNDPQLTATLTVSQIGAVPEASTWAMMILGFAGVGFMAYRRHQGRALAEA